MTDLLRTKMGFKGILVTDAMDMNGVLGKMTMAEATQRAIVAGNDVILMPTDVKVTGGTQTGDKATLNATGKMGTEPQKGEISMVNEAGAWKVAQEAWKN